MMQPAFRKTWMLLLLGTLFLPLSRANAASSPQSTLITLHALSPAAADGHNNDGRSPSSLIQGRDGNLYGTCQAGGANRTGTVFQLTTNGVYTVLHTFGPFTGNQDGTTPMAMVQDQSGALYGVCYLGGANGNGTVFKLDSQGVFTLLHTFGAYNPSYNNADGSQPATLVLGRDGSLYGSCQDGGLHGNGVLFKIDGTGAFSVLHTFSSQDALGNNADGFVPAALIQGIDGAFYGTCLYGGQGDAGTIFQMDRSGNFRTLYSFSEPTSVYGPDGGSPSTLLQGQDRILLWGGKPGRATISGETGDLSVSGFGEFVKGITRSTLRGRHEPTSFILP